MTPFVYIFISLSILFLSSFESYSMLAEKEERRRPPLLPALSTNKINDETKTPSSVGSSSSSSAAPQRVLLAVEDDPATIRLINRIAERKGWTLVLATSYNAAVEAYNQYSSVTHFAITSDHNLERSPTTEPKKGLDFARYVRETRQNQLVPIIMHSATTESGFDQTCADLNVETRRKGTASYGSILDHLFSLLPPQTE